MTNPLNTTKQQMNIPVTTVSQTSDNDLPPSTLEREIKAPIGLDDIQVPEIPAETVVVAKQPKPREAISSQVLTQQELNELTGAHLLDESIIARPLSAPEQLNVKPRDPAFALRWVNHKAIGGANYEKFKAMGYRNAKKEDVFGLHSDVMVKEDTIVYNDTILMIIDKKLQDGALKFNFERSRNMVSRKGATDRAKALAAQQFNEDLNSTGVPRSAVAGKVQFYTPSATETDNLVK